MPAPCPEEFHDDFVRVTRAREDGVTLAHIAKDFGIDAVVLHEWLHQADIDYGNRSGVIRKDSAELRQAA